MHWVGWSMSHEVSKSVREGYQDGVLEQIPTLVNLQCDIEMCIRDSLFGEQVEVALGGKAALRHAEAAEGARGGVIGVVGLAVNLNVLVVICLLYTSRCV